MGMGVLTDQRDDKGREGETTRRDKEKSTQSHEGFWFQLLPFPFRQI
jgi:hypothetical protein